VWLQRPKHNGRAIINDTLVDYGNSIAKGELKEKYTAAVKDGIIPDWWCMREQEAVLSRKSRLSRRF
jgi:hypothetical protein